LLLDVEEATYNQMEFGGGTQNRLPVPFSGCVHTSGLVDITDSKLADLAHISAVLFIS
jgi:hypothetical protein